MEEPYSKRELDEHFEDVNKRFDVQDRVLKKVDETISALDKKVGIQNGRVVKLESKWVGVTMAGAVIVVLFSVISGLIVYSFQLSQENLKNTILLEVRK